MGDEFGDASFLDDFDVDEVVASQSQPSAAPVIINQVGFKITTSNHTGMDSPRQVSPNQPNTESPFSSSSMESSKRVKSASAHPTKVVTEKALEEALVQYFGFDKFRPGQQEVLQALLLERKDVAVFWATGNGKSLCYQLPALVTGKTTIVISPLISLMQDQVRKLNHSIAPFYSNSGGVGVGGAGGKIATYLGSAQSDPREEQRALKGEYLFVYLTPEKLLSNGFLDALLQRLPNNNNNNNNNNKIGLFAFDEAHCVSQWGHDFRPEYRKAGLALRQHAACQAIPIVALTATAVPSIQQDICQTLQLHRPLIQQQSLDRPNLQISCKVKASSDATRSAMEELIQAYLLQEGKDSSSRSSSSFSSFFSTIVYAPTRALVEELASYLDQRLATTSLAINHNNNHNHNHNKNKNNHKKGGKKPSSLAKAYHAGMNLQARQQIHEDFLTGVLPIVVATTAFGMGIDKPDIRRVVHFGPPKNVEEYYQQMGRAGRDGQASRCILYFSASDFDKYLSDFYIGQLEGEAKTNAIASTNALKKYCLDSQTCRRKALLEFFQEKAPFGERCGTCDTCKVQTTYGKDATRDFRDLAGYIMRGIKCLKQPAITTLLTVLNGKAVEDYRYNRKMDASKFQTTRDSVQSEMNVKITNDLLKEMLLCLVSSNYVQTGIKKYNQGGYERSSTFYSLGSKGEQALLKVTQAIWLPVPTSIRQHEERQAKKRQELQEKLAKKGLNVPQEELEDLGGPTVRAYSTWFNSLERKEAQGQDVAIYDELLQLIESWRSQTAIQQRMAPAAVMAEHLVFSVAYMTSSLLPGCAVQVPALVAVGVRSGTVHELADILNDWVKRNKPQPKLESAGPNNNLVDLPMVAPTAAAAAAAGGGLNIIKLPKWKYAVYKANKKTGEPSWMSSYIRFMKDQETTQEIAMTKRNRPIQAATVVGHLQDAIQLGYPMDLQRLLPNSNAPTKQQWDRLEESIASRGLSVVDNPETSGIDGGKLFLTDCIRGIVGDELCDKNFKERTPEEADQLRLWMNQLKWYMCLTRVGFVPSFGTSSSEGGVKLAPDASKYTVPTTNDENKIMAQKIGTNQWVLPMHSNA